MTSIVVIKIQPRYQLAQSVLKIGSVLADRVGQGEVGGCTTLGWQYMTAIAAGYRKGLVSTGWPVLVQTSIENGPFTL